MCLMAKLKSITTTSLPYMLCTNIAAAHADAILQYVKIPREKRSQLSHERFSTCSVIFVPATMYSCKERKVTMNLCFLLSSLMVPKHLMEIVFIAQKL